MIPTMSPIEAYVFDTAGVLIRRNAIPLAEIELAKKAIATMVSPTVWKFPMLGLGDIFWEWLVRPELVQPAIELCGPHTRLDHVFGVAVGPGIEAPVQLHGGPDSSQFSCFYHNIGRDTGLVGQLNVGVTLIGQTPETGGFCYLPGSQHANRRIAGRELFIESFGMRILDNELVTVPVLNPGDIVYFSESLVHGDTGHRRPTDRRLMGYYRFTPGWMCWRDPAQQQPYREMARHPLARQLLEPPWTGRFDETERKLSVSNERRKNTNDY
jgi:hypothetical protein